MTEEKDMSCISMEDLLRGLTSRYKLVILASRRAMELNNGAQKLVGMSAKVKTTTIALEEIREGKITYKIRESGK